MATQDPVQRSYLFHLHDQLQLLRDRQRHLLQARALRQFLDNTNNTRGLAQIVPGSDAIVGQYYPDENTIDCLSDTLRGFEQSFATLESLTSIPNLLLNTVPVQVPTGPSAMQEELAHGDQRKRAGPQASHHASSLLVRDTWIGGRFLMGLNNPTGGQEGKRDERTCDLCWAMDDNSRCIKNLPGAPGFFSAMREFNHDGTQGLQYQTVCQEMDSQCLACVEAGIICRKTEWSNGGKRYNFLYSKHTHNVLDPNFEIVSQPIRYCVFGELQLLTKAQADVKRKPGEKQRVRQGKEVFRRTERYFLIRCPEGTGHPEPVRLGDEDDDDEDSAEADDNNEEREEQEEEEEEEVDEQKRIGMEDTLRGSKHERHQSPLADSTQTRGSPLQLSAEGLISSVDSKTEPASSSGNTVEEVREALEALNTSSTDAGKPDKSGT